MKRLAGTRTSIACIPYLFRQAAASWSRTSPAPLPSLGSNHTTAGGLAHWRVGGKTPWVRSGFRVLRSSSRGTWSPAFHLQGATHNCHQGAIAARSVGACKWASQKGSTPHLLSPPADVVRWSLTRTLGLSAVLKRTPASRLSCPVRTTQVPPSCGPDPYQPPRPVREREPGVSAVAPHSPLRRALALRPAAGGLRAVWRSRVHPPR